MSASVFVAVPHYGHLVTGSIESIVQASLKHRIHLQTAGGSLLAFVFNSLWCHALNKKPRPDFFAMHHSDIQAEAGWLDKLIDIMESHQADIVSVVVPIKDARGLTSTGYMDAKEDITRLTLKEIHQLPETFSQVPMLHGDYKPATIMVNTGLILVDFRKPWVEEFHFNIADGIKKNEYGRFFPCVLPEDWGMSAWAAKRNLKVFATRKVKAKHWGSACFSNHKPDGEWDHDEGDMF